MTRVEVARAVGYLAGYGFPVRDLTIVGVGVMQVERLVARVGWVRKLGRRACLGLWIGLFGSLSLLMTSDHPPGVRIATAVTGVLAGVVAGVVIGGVLNVPARRRAIGSIGHVLAQRYDLLCDPRSAQRAKDLLTRYALNGPG